MVSDLGIRMVKLMDANPNDAIFVLVLRIRLVAPARVNTSTVLICLVSGCVVVLVTTLSSFVSAKAVVEKRTATMNRFIRQYSRKLWLRLERLLSCNEYVRIDALRQLGGWYTLEPLRKPSSVKETKLMRGLL